MQPSVGTWLLRRSRTADDPVGPAELIAPAEFAGSGEVPPQLVGSAQFPTLDEEPAELSGRLELTAVPAPAAEVPVAPAELTGPAELVSARARCRGPGPQKAKVHHEAQQGPCRWQPGSQTRWSVACVMTACMVLMSLVLLQALFCILPGQQL
uniref:Uncharacterized protein n=1 Tax=Alexandrium monilatum TaxID=311494 RepID=A0A7S4RSU2_9DINO